MIDVKVKRLSLALSWPPTGTPDRAPPAPAVSWNAVAPHARRRAWTARP